jgi:hypothetical protein
MDRDRSGARGRRGPLFALVVWIAVAGALLPAAGTAGQDAGLDAWASAFPASLNVDLAAMALPADAYPVAGMVASTGRLLRPIEEATAHDPVLELSQPEVLARMRDAGWTARFVGEVVPASREAAGLAPTTGWSSITAYADADGAAEGFALLDETLAADAKVVPARQIGDASRLSRYTGTDNSGRPFDRLRYTFVDGPLVGSVALFRGADTPDAAMTPEAMVTMAERLLDRMRSAGAAPGLTGLVVRLGPSAGLPIDSHEEGYFSLGGRQIPHRGDTEETLAAASAFIDTYGVEASYIAHTTFAWQEGVDHRPAWLVALYRVGDADAAAELVRQHARYDRTVGYDTLVELDALPAVDWPVAGSAYTEAWPDGSQSAGYRITVAVGTMVAIVDVSAPAGVSEETAFALVEAQVSCLEWGGCAPIAAPFDAPDVSTPVA